MWKHQLGATFSIVLYPSDEFGAQELPEHELPCFVSRNSEQADAVWRWLKTFYPGDVEWNFDALFLVDQTGEPVGRYTARELPRVEADLKYLLTQSGSE
jgi:glutathione peroxidase-family protein